MSDLNALQRDLVTANHIMARDEIALQRVEIAHVEAPVMRKIVRPRRAGSAASLAPSARMPVGTPLARRGPAPTSRSKAINARHGFRFSR